MKRNITPDNAKEFINSPQRAFVAVAVKGINSKARTIRAYASTNAWDRYGERFEPRAFEQGLENFKKNPVVLFAHDYSNEPIGKVVEYEFDDKGLILVMKFANTPQAERIFSLYEGGFMSAFSVGFKPLEIAFEERVKGSGEMGAVFVRAELLENSAVPVPANPEAVVIRGLSGKTMTLDGFMDSVAVEVKSEEVHVEANIAGESEPAVSEVPAAVVPEPEAAIVPAVVIEEPKSLKEAVGLVVGTKSMAKCMEHINIAIGMHEVHMAEPQSATMKSQKIMMEHMTEARDECMSSMGPSGPMKIARTDSLKEAVGYLLTLGKSARENGKVEDAAVRSLLVQAVNLCRELVLGPGAQSLDGMDVEASNDISAEEDALCKEFALMTEKLMSSGKATAKDIEELQKIGKFIEDEVLKNKI